MDNKGFTLIELIMVIMIIAMLAMLATPNVIKLINQNKVDNYNSTIDSIEEAIELYTSEDRYNLIFDRNCNPNDSSITHITSTITLGDLIDRKNINSPVKNFCTNENISSNTEIIIKLDCNTKQFSYDIDVSTSENTLKKREDIDGLEGLKIPNDFSCDTLYQ